MHLLFILILQVTKTATRTLLPGHYSLNRIEKEIQEAFAVQKVDLQTEINTPLGEMIIHNPDMANISLRVGMFYCGLESYKQTNHMLAINYYYYYFFFYLNMFIYSKKALPTQLLTSFTRLYIH